MDNSLIVALALASLAGSTIPLGALLARCEHIRPQWLEHEFRHTVIAFGGGVLLAAVSLVLVPEGIRQLSLFWVIATFLAGGVVFFALDQLISRHGGSPAQLMAMLLDFIPEAIALGAALASGKPIGLLLALLIALQNFPEGFNAYRELMAQGRYSANRILISFCLLVLIGPLSAYLGHVFLASSPTVVGGLMLFAASGIIYLTFEDIAPQAVLKGRGEPPLGAVAGFLVGLAGHIVIA